MLCGGGTGGHITPVLAIAHELKVTNPENTIVYVGEKGGKFGNLTAGTNTIDEVHLVSAGKFRRYHNESWLVRLTDVKTNLLNTRDFFRFLSGTIQSLALLKKVKPDVIFLKGGYVCLPVGIAAAIWKIPYMTHESDSMPGIANRITSKRAKMNAVGYKDGDYGYQPDKTVFTGSPVRPEIIPVTPELRAEYRKSIGIPPDARVLLITGGSLGAVTINKSFASVAEELLAKYNDLYVIHTVGKGNSSVYDGIQKNNRLMLFEFIADDFYKYSGSADVVVTRGGANTLTELAVQAKPIIIVPNPALVQGHQTKNAELFDKAGAAEVVSEKDLLENKNALVNKITELLDHTDMQNRLSQNISKLANPSAAKDIANYLSSMAEK